MRALVFSIDDAYVMPFKVLWHSLMKTSSVPDRTPVFILHTETLSELSISDLKKFLEKYERAACFKDARAYIPDDLPLSHHVTKATYYRLYLASILPDDIDSAVYLDADAVVLRSVCHLFEVVLTKPLAAVDHMAPMEGFRLWGELSGQYFQAGVLVVDVSRWRADNYEAMFAEILTMQRDRILWHDQDVLNIAFENNWQRLPVWYNVCRYIRHALGDTKMRGETCFLHYDGSAKPWKVLQNTWSADAWYRTYEEAFARDFKKRQIHGSLKKRVLTRVISFLRRAERV